ncbi:uncharacterized protein LOC129579797 isoform X2 [Sitodiplosis mosellana]|uniref:uncharacterized protein LOC129579797 isoform X2 n=1 Tax=Sitodiplosis mosellana TaxID=263140 RepID=UPI002444B255|nr:uncharacterized protein LOC129579797 isoform X2 [Sitodiplosis mosellana]
MFSTKFDEATKLWSGVTVPPIYNPNVNCAHVLLSSMKVHGSKFAQINADTGVKITFAEMRMHTISMAENLQKRGCQPKQVIGIMADHTDHLSSVILASLGLGCPSNVLGISVEKSDIIKMFRLTEPSFIFCEVEKYDLMKECLKELNNDAPIFTFNGTKGDSESVESLFEVTGTEDIFIPVEVDGINDVAVISSSSGTTGPFKGVCLPYAALLWDVQTLDIITSDDVLYTLFTYQWITAYAILFWGVLCGSLRVISNVPFSPQTQLRLLEDYKITCTMYTPHHIAGFLKSGLLPKTNLPNFKRILLGAYKVSFLMLDEFRSYLPNTICMVVYGTTEVGYLTVASNGSHSEGQMVGGFHLKIVDSMGNRCGVGENGEIHCKGPYKFLGYYRNEELSADAIDDEGFFPTGDIAHFDTEGNLHLIDRVKNLISTHSLYSIAPTEIEEILLKNNDIKDVCVVGIPYEGGDLPAALVVRADKSQITAEAVCNIVEVNLNIQLILIR